MEPLNSTAPSHALRLSNLRMFDATSGDELQEGEAVQDDMKVLLALDQPAGEGPSAAASAFASVISAVGRHKLGLDADAPCLGRFWQRF